MIQIRPVSDLRNHFPKIKERLPVAESFEPFRSVRERSHLYYRIFVKNFTIFYVVIEDVMEMRRILYSRRDLEKWISL